MTTIAPARTEARALDIALCAVVVLSAAAIGGYAAAAAHGLMPAQNALFDADTGRVLADYTGEAANYYRLKVHPWQGWLFAFQQLVLARILPPPVAVPLLSTLIAAASAGLLYAVLRRFAIGAWAAAAYALLYCATAGYVFWASLPEAHMAGGAATLAAVLLLTGEKQSRGRSIAALAVGFSMVVTNAMIWILRQIEFEPLRRGWNAFLAANRAKLPDLIRQGAAGTGLIVLVWGPQWLFLHKRIGIPFNVFEERHYLDVGTGGASVHVLGLLPPGSGAALVAALAAVAVLIAALRILPPRYWFVPAFPLFGVLLHMIYGSDSAFLFAPNYLPLWVVSLALVAERMTPKWSAAAALPVAAGLLAFNLHAYKGHLNALDAAGQMKTYHAAVKYEDQ